MKKLILLLVCVFGFGYAIQAQEDQPSPIIFIYDASGSMWGQLQGKTKMEIASEVLAASINTLPENQNLGLVAYGHRKKGDCSDVEFLIEMDNLSKTKVVSELQKIKPLGKTPLAYAAELVLEKLRVSKEKATIILITDGIESCNGNICDLVQNAKTEGIDFKLHIVGFGLKESETEQLTCAANAGEGQYYDASDAGGLSEGLLEATSETIDAPKGNLGVFVLKEGKPLDAYVQAYTAGTKNKVVLKRTYKDTAFLFLPKASYDLEIWQHSKSAISPVVVKNVETFEDKIAYKTVSMDGAKLKLLISNNGTLWDSNIGVKTIEGKNVIGGRTYGKEKELQIDPGTYNIEVIGRTLHGLEATSILKNVQVGSGEVTEISHDFKTGIAIIGGTYGGEAFDVGIKIVDAATKEAVYGGRTYKKNKEILLITGTYIVSIYEHGVYNSSAKGTEFTMEIKEGETVTEIREIK